MAMCDSVYLDNAATSYPKPTSVITAMQNALQIGYGNPSRGNHRFSLSSAEAMFQVRESVAELIGLGDSRRIIFTQNATMALNMAIFGLIREPCHILISDLEHNSVVRPVEELRKRIGVVYDTFKTEGDIEHNIRQAIRPDTRYIVSTLASNVSGRIVPLSVLSKIRREYGVCVIGDASQVIGHLPIDLSRFPIDVLCAPGHKGLFGYMGCGFVAIASEVELVPHLYGGSGSHSLSLTMPQEYPDRLEAGTLPFYAILSMGYGIEHIRQEGLPKLAEKVEMLTRTLCDDLADIKDLKLISEGRLGIVSLHYARRTPDQMSEYLNQNGILTRSGLHCAPLAHRTYHTEKDGLVRISLSSENTQEHIARVRDVIWNMIKAIK